MPYFRASRTIYQVGDPIWEVAIGVNALANIELYRKVILDRNDTALLRTNLLSSEQVGDAWSAAKEAALEIVRESIFDGLPCRFKNMMVFSDVEDAQVFHKKFRSKGFLYELEYTGDTPFTGDMHMLDIVKIPSVGGLLEMAHNYWSGVQSESPIKETILSNNRVSCTVKNRLQ